jgi:serine palmitoyltransferase
VEGPYGPHVQIGGEDYLNFSSNGFLGYHVHPEIIDTAIECTNRYGVGACGPRGFYGSFDTHLELEKNIAKFMGTADCVIFTSEFQTIASVIPSFAKPGDYLVCDKGVSFAIQNGILLSRSTVKWFEHNNMDDLHRVLQSLSEVFRKQKNRVFLVVESIYSNYGDLLDLKTVLQFKEKYPFRIILEESYSIGVLGKTGRGLTESIGVPATKVEIITGSIGNALGSVGGFAVGTVAIANHMRLNCSGYVFSCSSPPFISKTCTLALELLSTGQEINFLHKNIQNLHQGLATCKHLITSSSVVSPLVVLRLAESSKVDKQQDEITIQSIIDELYHRKIVVTRAKYSKREAFILKQEPHFYIAVSALHTTEDIQNFIQELNHVIAKIIKQ